MIYKAIFIFSAVFGMLAGTLICSFCALADDTSWSTYEGASGYLIQYPSDWTVMEPESGNLKILSDNRRSNATVIDYGESAIVVKEIEIPPDGNFRAIAEKTGENTFEDKFIKFSNPLGNGCKSAERIGRYYEVVPSQRQMQTYLFCQIGRRGFEIVLQNWERDGRNSKYLDIETRMIKSLEVK